jgi:hypothetical protein
MALTRRRFLLGTAAAAFPGQLYRLADALAAAPRRLTPAGSHFKEQNVIQDLRVVTEDGVIVFEPPRYSEVVTVKLRLDGSSLAEARGELEQRLRLLDNRYFSTPSGLAVTTAWGLPYFARFVAGQTRAEMPRDVRASVAAGKPVAVLEPSERFPSDRSDLILEANDVAVLLRSDSLDRIAEGYETIFSPATGFLNVTSRRKGFAGGAFGGGPGLPKLMATAAKIPAAASIPDGAELFLGFTSTPKEHSGLERIVNLETLGYVDLGPSGGYFRHGTHMHLSHLYEDLEAWYGSSDFAGRAASMFHPGLDVPNGRQTMPQGPAQTQSATDTTRAYHHSGIVGHAGSIQAASRLERAVRGPDGVLYPKGSPIAHRADFNTLDHPFSFSSDPARDGMGSGASAGLHFVVFNPTSDDFRRNRLAMDGRFPDGTEIPLAARSSTWASTT